MASYWHESLQGPIYTVRIFVSCDKLMTGLQLVHDCRVREKNVVL